LVEFKEHWGKLVPWLNPRSTGWTSGLDKSKRPHWRCGQVDYTKNCVVHEWKVLCIGEFITPNGPVTWIGPRWHWE
jgi:hypothetical protein